MTGTRILLLNVRCSFPQLVTPRSVDPNGPAKYGIVILIPKDTPEGKKQYAEVMAALEQAAQAKWGDKRPKFARQFPKDGDLEDRPEYAGHWVLPMNSARKPGVLDRAKRVNDGSCVYPGEYVHITGNAFVYDRPTGRGWTIGLNSVMSTGVGDSFAGNNDPEADFEDVEIPDPSVGLDELLD